MANKQFSFGLKLWLWIGLVMVFIQVMIGGITRLTDSGLSITEWEVIKGVMPPVNDAQWDDAFNKYKTEARKQFETIHADMTLQEFKTIYYWEYIHRMWARLMGIVFIIPFVIFYMRKQIDKLLLRKLIVVIFFASLAGIFGWLMVRSGLNNDDRTWVNAYNLVIHLLIAIATFCAIYWAIAYVSLQKEFDFLPGQSKRMKSLIYSVILVTVLQVIIGGLMAGMRAGLLHPHWPVYINGSWFFSELVNLDSFSQDDLLNYEPSVFVKAWVQAIHRGLPYLILGLSILIYIYARGKYWFTKLKKPIVLIIVLVLVQAFLGIMTVMNSIGRIPVLWGVIHQLMALILIAAQLHLLYMVKLAGKQ